MDSVESRIESTKEKGNSEQRAPAGEKDESENNTGAGGDNSGLKMGFGEVKGDQKILLVPVIVILSVGAVVYVLYNQEWLPRRQRR